MELDGPSQERWQLGAELRRLRERAGVSGRELAARIGLSQSTVSRIEAGTSALPLELLPRWVRATDAPADTEARLAELVGAADAQDWRPALAQGHLQDRVRRREAAARAIRVFHPALVPGLLQTAQYAEATFRLFHVPQRGGGVPAAVAARLERQSVLYSSRAFTFLLYEAALHWRPGPPAVLLGQLDRIVSVATLRNVSVEVIPLGIEATAPIYPAFDLLDLAAGGQLVTTEQVHAGVVVRRADQIAEYEAAWTRLRRMAVTGADALALVARVRAGVGK